MYLDLYNNITINKKMLKLVGMPAALYWAELQEILQRVFDKKTFNENGFFKLDRAYVEKEISLSLKEQYDCDAQLIQLGIMVKDENDPDSLCVSVERYVAVISAEDPQLLKDLAKAAKPTKNGKKKATEEEKAAKLAGKKATLKKLLVEPNKNVYDALCRWIDAIFEAETYSYKMTKAAIETFQATLYKYTLDPQVMEQIIEIAAAQGWVDASWAINRYQSNSRTNATRLDTPQKVSTGGVGQSF